MELLDELVDHGDQRTICGFYLTANAIFVEADNLPWSFVPEYLGRAAFLREQLIRRQKSSNQLKQGIFLGAREVQFNGPPPQVGRNYWVVANNFFRNEGLATSRCKLTPADDPETVLASGRLSARLTESDAFLEGLRDE